MRPEDLARTTGTFDHGFKFRPADRVVSDFRAEAAICAGDNIFTANNLGVADEPLGDEIGMLDKIGAMPHNAGYQGGALWQLHRLEDPPFMLMARIRALD